MREKLKITVLAFAAAALVACCWITGWWFATRMHPESIIGSTVIYSISLMLLLGCTFTTIQNFKRMRDH